MHKKSFARYYKALAILILFSGCNGEPQKQPGEDHSTAPSENKEIKKPEATTIFNWTGQINKTIPIFLHYSLQDKLIVGTITYLNTIGQKPIRIIGNIEEDKSYRLLEFEQNGNITGIITGSPDTQAFNGSWFSPKTRKEFALTLTKKDTVIAESALQPDRSTIYGAYHYQYSEKGYQGDVDIKKISDNKIAFSIFAVTGDPARNIAEVSTDTVALTGNNFIYKIPDTDSCEFKVTFYKDFLTIDYTKGYCNGQFGMNATVDGIFLQLKKQ